MIQLSGVVARLWLNLIAGFGLRMERMGFGGCIGLVKEVLGKVPASI